jgi:hypothetical protein
MLHLFDAKTSIDVLEGKISGKALVLVKRGARQRKHTTETRLQRLNPFWETSQDKPQMPREMDKYLLISLQLGL